MKNLNYDFLNCAKKMPPLHHSVPGEKFNIKKSQVAEWLVQQPEILQKIFNMASNNRAIHHNSQNGTWQGVDYDGD